MLASSKLGGQSQNTLSRRLAVAGFSACLCLATVLAGCGGSTATEEVSGSVSYRGKAVFPGKILLRSQSGKGLSANLTADGEFRVFGIEKGEVYSVAIESIRLGGIGSRGKANAKLADSTDAEMPANREETIPEKFRQANISFPKKYSSFDTSGLSVDCSQEVPQEKQVFELQ